MNVAEYKPLRYFLCAEKFAFLCPIFYKICIFIRFLWTYKSLCVTIHLTKMYGAHENLPKTGIPFFSGRFTKKEGDTC